MLATANLLLEVDEAQDILTERYDKDIAPHGSRSSSFESFLFFTQFQHVLRQNLIP